jgi:endonuclease/exonuclease/phosphatase family metal-dependent hydrolase
MKILSAFIVVAVLATVGFGADQPSSAATLRVMSYNIQHGRGMDGKVDLERIAEVIKEAKAEIVALQEVDRGVARTDRRDLPAELAKLTGMEVFFDKNIPHQDGEYGNAVLTRFPILQRTNTHLRMLRPHEQRGVIQLILDVHGRKVLFMNTHIDYRREDSERLENVAQFKEILAGYPGMPVIFCGDFNDLPGSRTHKGMKALLADAWEMAGESDGFTFRADNPVRRIDYIWISPEMVKPLKLWVPSTLASDHLPLVAELQLK